MILKSISSYSMTARREIGFESFDMLSCFEPKTYCSSLIFVCVHVHMLFVYKHIFVVPGFRLCHGLQQFVDQLLFSTWFSYALFCSA